MSSLDLFYAFTQKHLFFLQNATIYIVAYSKNYRKYSIMENTNLTHKKKIVAMAPYDRGWSNVEFLKDCGLIPYLLYKNHNCDVTFVGAKREEWPYLEQHLKGVKTDILPTGTVDEKLAYIREHAKTIDCLILRGAYETNFAIAILYKQLNPNGKIYVGLDANSHWMDRIPWFQEDFVNFMNSCDVIATSCTAMQMHLNEKWPWVIEHIPNGYYDIYQQNIVPDFSTKENSILTVARIGTAQKSNHIMLEGFAYIAKLIPDWHFYLVGSIEPDFNMYIEEYFKYFPDLKSRVHFTGPIHDKEKLKDMYLKAKVFALSSIMEGGTPNVIGEALSSGCAVVTTKVDAWEDAINHGKCGVACPMNDSEAFARSLYQLCSDPALEEKNRAAYNYALEHFDMEKIVARLYLMLFGEE